MADEGIGFTKRKVSNSSTRSLNNFIAVITTKFLVYPRKR